MARCVKDLSVKVGMHITEIDSTDVLIHLHFFLVRTSFSLNSPSLWSFRCAAFMSFCLTRYADADAAMPPGTP